MDPTPAELPPGCLVLLLRLAADMTADVVTSRGELPPFVAARQLADELLEGLVNTVAGGYAIGEIDVAVLGYRIAEDGTPQLFSLLPGDDAKPRFVPLTRLCELPVEVRAGEGQPRKWTLLPPCEGDAGASAALASVYQMVAVWLTGRFTNRPPVVIHCTTPKGLDDVYFRIARSLNLLTTGYGPARLLHYLFDNQGEQGELATCWDQLFDVSCVLPENLDTGKPVRRALWVNDWDITDPWDAIFGYSWQADSIAWTEAGAGFSRNHAVWTQKMGNSPEQWEDAFAVEAASGVAAVADGASTGIYCRIWADQLSRRFLTDRPDTRDPISLNKWVNGLRTEWRSAINYSNLNWSKQAKVDQVGAAATLLGLELGPADEAGNRPWRAGAVGDASLFWVRSGQLLASFPVVAADQFGSAPLLIRSNPGFKTLAVAAAGTCQPGDRFLLATDAVAARLFKSTALGPGPDWSRFETISEDEWRAELDTLRNANDMVNDDCTLVVLEVSGAEDRIGAAGDADKHGSERDVDRELRTEDGNETPEQKAKDRNQRMEMEQESAGLSADLCSLASEQNPEPQAPITEHVDPPPADESPAARDGFPESTDPSV